MEMKGAKMDFTLRRFSKEDIPSVLEIHNGNNPDNLKTLEEMIQEEKARNPDRRLSQWVIEKNKKIAAYSDCGEVNATTAEDANHFWITVHSDFLGQGLGVRLLEECINYTKECQCKSLITGMSEKQKHSISWMVKRGFEQVGSFAEMNLLFSEVKKDMELKPELNKITLSTLEKEEEKNQAGKRKLYDEVGKPLLALVEMPGGAKMNPTYQEFLDMFVICNDAKSDGQMIVKKDGAFIGYCSLLMGVEDKTYINYIDLKREFVGQGIEEFLLLETIKLSKEHGYQGIKTHVETGSVLPSFIKAMEVLGFERSSGRVIWEKRI
ncbi:GNAT family N-acetyltransferase [Listeria ivanovii]|nr:GNAT family N-acetyltransferase [Listeria ivanovii]